MDVLELQQNDMSSSEEEEEEEEEESSFDEKYYEHENFDPQQAYRNLEFYLNNSMHKTNPTATTTTTAISTSTTKKAVDYDPSRHIVQWTPLPTPQQQQGGGGMQDGACAVASCAACHTLGRSVAARGMLQCISRLPLATVHLKVGVV